MKKTLKIIALLILFLFVGFLLIKAKEGNKVNEAYPKTTDAPVLKLTWPEKLNPEDAIRYTPYGIWENTSKYKEGIAYEPANEMQFYMKTNASDYLTVAPGIVTRSETFENSVGLVSIKYGENYVITYLHIIPNKDLKVGNKVEISDVIGKMEKRNNPYHGEETWWEVQLTVKRGKLYRTLPPYDYLVRNLKKC